MEKGFSHYHCPSLLFILGENEPIMYIYICVYKLLQINCLKEKSFIRLNTSFKHQKNLFLPSYQTPWHLSHIWSWQSVIFHPFSTFLPVFLSHSVHTEQIVKYKIGHEKRTVSTSFCHNITVIITLIKCCMWVYICCYEYEVKVF